MAERDPPVAFGLFRAFTGTSTGDLVRALIGARQRIVYPQTASGAKLVKQDVATGAAFEEAATGEAPDGRVTFAVLNSGGANNIEARLVLVIDNVQFPLAQTVVITPGVADTLEAVGVERAICQVRHVAAASTFTVAVMVQVPP